MSKFDPTRDPPYYAVLSRCPPPGANAGQFLDAGERMIGLAAAEPGFLGIEETTGPDGTPYTVCYWRKSTSLRRWRAEIQDRIPVGVNVDDVVCFEGCLWHWLNDVFDAVARTETSNIVTLQKDEKAA